MSGDVFPAVALIQGDGGESSGFARLLRDLEALLIDARCNFGDEETGDRDGETPGEIDAVPADRERCFRAAVRFAALFLARLASASNPATGKPLMRSFSTTMPLSTASSA